MNKKTFFLAVFAMAAAAAVFLYFNRDIFDSSSKLRVVFFNIGQGDSALIVTPAGQTVLVDGGPGDTVLSRLGRARPFQKKIDYMILTHPHADHLEGLVAVLKKYGVGEIYYSGAVHTSPAFLEWLKLIKEKNISLKIVSAGQKLELDSGVRLDFLWPLPGAVPASVEAGGGETGEESKNQKFNSLNNTSVIFKLAYGRTSFLFTGDAEEPVEGELLKNEEVGRKLKADVLKVGHHGSRTSTGEEFLSAVRPKIAVISSGKDNDFGHPHLRVLRRLERFGVRILRTDKAGDIWIESDQKTVAAKGYGDGY